MCELLDIKGPAISATDFHIRKRVQFRGSVKILHTFLNGVICFEILLRRAI